MKTLMVAVRVTDLDRSLRFYTAIGYVELGRIASGDGGTWWCSSSPANRWPRSSSSIVWRAAR
jgi:lactoylglutathione lyase